MRDGCFGFGVLMRMRGFMALAFKWVLQMPPWCQCRRGVSGQGFRQVAFVARRSERSGLQLRQIRQPARGNEKRDPKGAAFRVLTAGSGAGCAG